MIKGIIIGAVSVALLWTFHADRDVGAQEYTIEYYVDWSSANDLGLKTERLHLGHLNLMYYGPYRKATHEQMMIEEKI